TYVTYQIPTATIPGTYYLIAVADAEDSVKESYEDNNTRTATVTVPGPDLVVSALSAPTSVTVNTPFTVKDTTKNQGTKPTTVDSTTKYYLSTTSTLAGVVSDILVIQPRVVGPLAAGASSTTLSTVSNNATINTKGTWFIIA